MTLRVLIVDDELLARERLRRMLGEMGDVEITGEATDGVHAVKLIEALAPDVVLLDIQMPGLDGFGVIEAVEDLPPVVFVTAYDAYAIHAFEVNALDYLLKPFSQARLVEAIERARAVQDQAQDDQVQPTRRFAARFGPLLESLERLAVRDQEGVRVLDVHQVDWIDIQSSTGLSLSHRRCVHTHPESTRPDPIVGIAPDAVGGTGIDHVVVKGAAA